MRELRLRGNAERRVRLGHPWIFSNEVDIERTPVVAFAPGELARVTDARGKPVGIAYVNPQALICARILSTDVRAVIDRDFFIGRLRHALELRKKIYPTPHYRAVFGESDRLPGLVIDRYGEVVVAQLNTAGMFARKALLVDAIQAVFAPPALLLTSAASVRALEGLGDAEEVHGDLPDEVQIFENGCSFRAPLRGGQKTGYFYDQRDNRARVARYSREARVLDAYSYVGAWAISALRGGAVEAVCVDSSSSALDFAVRNAIGNGRALSVECGDAIEVLERYARERRRFDVVVVDPPALIKRRKDAASGERLYERVYRAAMRAASEGGIVVAASCSYHFSAEAMARVILGAARAEGRRVQILEQHGQPPDHPVHPAMLETRYLKTFFLRV